MTGDRTPTALSMPGRLRAGDAEGPLPPDELARAYQPRRVWGAAISTAWNLFLIALLVGTGAAEQLYLVVRPEEYRLPGFFLWFTPLYLGVIFGAYALLNFPLELWLGYLGDRQFGLAKDGIRAWTRDWIGGNIQHGLMFVAGSSVIVALQKWSPESWLALLAPALLAIFLVTLLLADLLVPRALFQWEPAPIHIRARLGALLPQGLRASLPPVIIYSHPALREFAGGLLGCGPRRRMLVSRSTLESASDDLLRFVLMHDLGHRHYRHNLLAMLSGWAWVVLGLAIGQAVIPHAGRAGVTLPGSPVYIAHLALILSGWMALGEPVLAYLGRRLEYQADRFYLRHGGTVEQMRRALLELAMRNLAQTHELRRRQSFLHPLPSVPYRLFEAKRFARQLQIQR